MEKNNQPLILGIVVIGAVLIIALALIFTRSDETATETTGETNTAESTVSENEENGESSGRKITPQPNPDPQPAPDPVPVPVPDPQPQPMPEPTNGLPPNWHSLTSQEKTDINPFDCDHATQWVSAEDGSCINKPVVIDPDDIECPEGQKWVIDAEGGSCEPVIPPQLKDISLIYSHIMNHALNNNGYPPTYEVFNSAAFLTTEAQSALEYYGDGGWPFWVDASIPVNRHAAENYIAGSPNTTGLPVNQDPGEQYLYVLFGVVCDDVANDRNYKTGNSRSFALIYTIEGEDNARCEDNA